MWGGKGVQVDLQHMHNRDGSSMVYVTWHLCQQAYTTAASMLYVCNKQQSSLWRRDNLSLNHTAEQGWGQGLVASCSSHSFPLSVNCEH